MTVQSLPQRLVDRPGLLESVKIQVGGVDVGVGGLEFYINFGLPGLVVGFLCLGWLIGFLDLKAASAERRGDLKSVFVYFLPAVAVIQPGASIVEISGSAGAAFLIAFGWRWLWTMQGGSRPAARPGDMTRLPQSNPGGAS